MLVIENFGASILVVDDSTKGFGFVADQGMIGMENE
jgi:hypothetical protein